MAKVIARPPAGDLYEEDFSLWAERQRRGWLVTVDKQRIRLARKLTATLKNHLAAELPALYAGVRRPVARQLEKDGVPPDALPAACPYTLDQILDPDWYPNNLHGLTERLP